MRNRLGTLDCLRGIAAAAVVLFHIGQVKIVEGLAPHAYLAVDFFFILSGFVIARTYEQKIAEGAMSVPVFLTRRAIRLYPLIFFGVALGAIVMLLKTQVDPIRSYTMTALLADIVANFLLLPAPLDGPKAQGFLFPGNGVLWSVFLEAAINIVWCLLLVHMRTSRIILIVAAAFACLVISILNKGTANLGFDWGTLSCGISRVTYGFGLGVLISRAAPVMTNFGGAVLKSAAISLLAAILLWPSGFAVAGLFDVLAVGLLLPLVLLLGINAADHPRLDTVLGEMSYPLYVVHFPILLFASGLHQKFTHIGTAPLLGGVFVALVTTVTLLFFLVDRPVRAALSRLVREDSRFSRRHAHAMCSSTIGYSTSSNGLKQLK